MIRHEAYLLCYLSFEVNMRKKDILSLKSGIWPRILCYTDVWPWCFASTTPRTWQSSTVRMQRFVFPTDGLEDSIPPSLRTLKTTSFASHHTLVTINSIVQQFHERKWIVQNLSANVIFLSTFDNIVWWKKDIAIQHLFHQQRRRSLYCIDLCTWRCFQFFILQ